MAVLTIKARSIPYCLHCERPLSMCHCKISVRTTDTWHRVFMRPAGTFSLITVLWDGRPEGLKGPFEW